MARVAGSTQTPAPAAGDGAAADADGAAGVRIRMYRVGFGDFFLVSIPSGDGLAHILVDCGVHAHDLGAMPAALTRMKADTGGRLALVIMTHRHADHISGFATGRDLFSTFQVERVWMSWFEDPTDQVGARIQSQLTAIARRLQAALGARRAPGDEPYQNMAGNILGAAANGGNDAALEVLRSFKTPDGAATPVDYYRAGDTANLPPSLVGAGLTAQILGPPTDLALVAQMDNHAHQYLTAGSGDADDARPFDPAFDAGPLVWPKLEGDPHWLEPLYDDADIQKHIADNTPDALAAAAQTADNAINNQSLVVLFRFKGKSMLFCGDAQWGNWANFLFGGAIGAGQATLKPESRDILATLDFLKVGHHGSTNATPMDVVDALRTGCAAMCSTDPGAYGNPDKGTEVPRVPLIQALTAKTNQQLARSDQVSVNGHDPTPNLGPLPAVFSAGPDNSQFVDYTL